METATLVTPQGRPVPLQAPPVDPQHMDYSMLGKFSGFNVGDLQKVGPSPITTYPNGGADSYKQAAMAQAAMLESQLEGMDSNDVDLFYYTNYLQEEGLMVRVCLTLLGKPSSLLIEDLSSGRISTWRFKVVGTQGAPFGPTARIDELEQVSSESKRSDDHTDANPLPKPMAVSLERLPFYSRSDFIWPTNPAGPAYAAVVEEALEAGWSNAQIRAVRAGKAAGMGLVRGEPADAGLIARFVAISANPKLGAGDVAVPNSGEAAPAESGEAGASMAQGGQELGDPNRVSLTDSKLDLGQDKLSEEFFRRVDDVVRPPRGRVPVAGITTQEGGHDIRKRTLREAFESGDLTTFNPTQWKAASVYPDEDPDGNVLTYQEQAKFYMRDKDVLDYGLHPKLRATATRMFIQPNASLRAKEDVFIRSNTAYELMSEQGQHASNSESALNTTRQLTKEQKVMKEAYEQVHSVPYQRPTYRSQKNRWLFWNKGTAQSIDGSWVAGARPSTAYNADTEKAADLYESIYGRVRNPKLPTAHRYAPNSHLRTGSLQSSF